MQVLVGRKCNVNSKWDLTLSTGAFRTTALATVPPLP